MRKTVGLLMHAIPLALLVLLGAGEARAQGRNILLIVADDFGVDAARFYPLSAGRRTTDPPAPPTPNLTRLAQNGILFRRAWATPWCSPSRAEIFTGRYPFRTGVGDPVPKDPTKANGELRLDEFSLPEAFQAAKPGQYLLAHVGKWHLSRQGADDPNRHGWPYFAGPRPDLPLLPHYGTYFRIDGVNYYGPWPKTVNGVTTAAVNTYATTDQVNEAIAKIREAKAQVPPKPYFIWLAFNAPHGPYEKPPNALHSRDSLPVPATHERRRPFYEAMVEAMDTEIGRLLQEVDLATTTVFFIGDNGTPDEVTVSPYRQDHAEGTPYEEGLRVPLLVAGADVVTPGRVVTRIVSAVDLYPTILELAGIDPRAVLPSGTAIDGVSIVRYLRNQTGTALRQYIYSEEFPLCHDQQFERAIANCCYKLIRRADGSRAFYDLNADPYETRNLLSGTLTATQRGNLDTLSARLANLLATGAGPCEPVLPGGEAAAPS
jgi:arylsulfatase A-like enzyme